MPKKADENKNKKRGLKVIAIAAGLVLVGGVAFAYWTQGGSGTGQAATGDTVDITVNQTSEIVGLAPGGAPQTLAGNFDNPNSGPVFVQTVTASIDEIVAPGDCDATDYTLANPVMTVGAEVPSGNSMGNWSGATLAFNNKSGVSQDGCKGAIVHLAYTAS